MGGWGRRRVLLESARQAAARAPAAAHNRQLRCTTRPFCTAASLTHNRSLPPNNTACPIHAPRRCSPASPAWTGAAPWWRAAPRCLTAGRRSAPATPCAAARSPPPWQSRARRCGRRRPAADVGHGGWHRVRRSRNREAWVQGTAFRVWHRLSQRLSTAAWGVAPNSAGRAWVPSVASRLALTCFFMPASADTHCATSAACEREDGRAAGGRRRRVMNAPSQPAVTLGWAPSRLRAGDGTGDEQELPFLFWSGM